MSSCCWLRITSSLTNGISIINTIDNGKFEHFTRRILVNKDKPSNEIFNQGELVKLEKIFNTNENNVMLVIKTTHYLLKRMLKFVFKPIILKNDLLSLGLIEEKVDLFIKIWSAETKTTLSDLVSHSNSEEHNLVNIKWELRAELSSDIKKDSKVPKATLAMSGGGKACGNVVELSHTELHNLFLQLEDVQTELDNIM